MLTEDYFLIIFKNKHKYDATRSKTVKNRYDFFSNFCTCLESSNCLGIFVRGCRPNDRYEMYREIKHKPVIRPLIRYLLVLHLPGNRSVH